MADYQGIPGIAPAGWGLPSNEIMSPENIQYHYDENGVLKVDAVAADSRGNIPAGDPAPENQGDNFHRADSPSLPGAYFDSNEIATRAGYFNNDMSQGWYKVGDKVGSPSGLGPDLFSQRGAAAKLAKIAAIVNS